MKPRIAFMGAGAVGGYVGGHLHRMGHDVTLIDAWPDADAMLVTGNPEATALTLPPRMDVVTLPTLAKDADGTYRSRTLTAPVDSVLQMRSAVIEAAILVSRLHMLAPEKIDAELAYLRIAIDKTAGPDELKAWGWLMDRIETHRA